MKYLFLAFTLILSSAAFSAESEKKMGIKNINTPTEKPANNATTQLDDLVRGELAALKTYNTVLKDTKDEKVKSKLKAIHKDHSEAVAALSKFVAGKPALLEDTESAGAWGGLTKAWTKGSTLIGNDAALKVLVDGEQHGIEEYQEALNDKTIPQNLKDAIKSHFIPAQKRHIETLKSL